MTASNDGALRHELGQVDSFQNQGGLSAFLPPPSSLGRPIFDSLHPNRTEMLAKQVIQKTNFIPFQFH